MGGLGYEVSPTPAWICQAKLFQSFRQKKSARGFLQVASCCCQPHLYFEAF